MRIISGSAKGRKILSPLNEGKITQKGELQATRPTLDRVKVSMFDILGHKVFDAEVLDMFAGSGTTLLAAKNTNREFLGCELDKDFYEKTKERLNV